MCPGQFSVLVSVFLFVEGSIEDKSLDIIDEIGLPTYITSRDQELLQ
jgi:hypothetical protein